MKILEEDDSILNKKENLKYLKVMKMSPEDFKNCFEQEDDQLFYTKTFTLKEIDNFKNTRGQLENPLEPRKFFS